MQKLIRPLHFHIEQAKSIWLKFQPSSTKNGKVSIFCCAQWSKTGQKYDHHPFYYCAFFKALFLNLFRHLNFQNPTIESKVIINTAILIAKMSAHTVSPGWANGQGVRLQIGRSVVRAPAKSKSTYFSLNTFISTYP